MRSLFASLALGLFFYVSSVSAYNDYAGKMKDFLGANGTVNMYDNGRVNDFAQVFKWLRDYHSWSWCENPNDNYIWGGSTWPRHTQFMQALNGQGVNVLMALMLGNSWISGPDEMPYDNGTGTSEINYRERAEYIAQMAARYGRTTHPAGNLESTDKWSGLDLIRFYEDYNEPDQWWSWPQWSGANYAKWLNAAFDGYNCPDGGTQPLRGIKMGDPNAIHVLGGLAGANTNYLNAIMANRGRATVPFNILNYHVYCTGSGAGGDNDGYAPEHPQFGLKPSADAMKKWRDAHLPGMPIWCTEFGWDTFDNGGSHSYTFARGPNPYVSQANYLMRGFILLKGYGIDKAFMFMEDDPASWSTVQYSSSGIVKDASWGYAKKTSFYYLATMQSVIGNMYFDRIDKYAQGTPEVYSYVFRDATSATNIYMIWCRNPSSKYDDGTVINNYALNVPGAMKASKIECLDGSTTGLKTDLVVAAPGTGAASVTVSQLKETPLFIRCALQTNIVIPPTRPKNISVMRVSKGTNRITWNNGGMQGRYKILSSTTEPISEFNKNFSHVKVLETNWPIGLSSYTHRIDDGVRKPYWYGVTVCTGQLGPGGNQVIITNDMSGWGDWLAIYWGDWKYHNITGFGNWYAVTNASFGTNVAPTWTSFQWIDWTARNVSAESSLVFSVRIISGTNLKNGLRVNLNNAGSDLLVSSYASLGTNWTEVSIPLADFGVPLNAISQVIFKAPYAPKNAYGIDEIRFVGNLNPVLFGDAQKHDNVYAVNGSQTHRKHFSAGGSGVPYTHLRMYLKVYSGDLSTLKVSLESTNGGRSGDLPINNYCQPSSKWQQVLIPISDFINGSTNLDLTRVYNLVFKRGSYPQVVFGVDELEFIALGGSLPSQVLWGNADGHLNINATGGTTVGWQVTSSGGVPSPGSYYEFPLVAMTNASVLAVTNERTNIPVPSLVRPLKLSATYKSPGTNFLSWKKSGISNASAHYKIYYSTNGRVNNTNKFMKNLLATNLAFSLTNFRHAVPHDLLTQFWYGVTVATGVYVTSGTWLSVTNDTFGGTNSWGCWFQLFFDGWAVKNVSAYPDLQFVFRQVGGDLSGLTVNLNGEGNDVFVKNYVTIEPQWKVVTIPKSAFGSVNFNAVNSVIFKASHVPRTSYGLDEVQFTGSGSLLVWGEALPHTAMQGGAGTVVRRQVNSVGGYSPASTYAEASFLLGTNVTADPVANQRSDAVNPTTRPRAVKSVWHSPGTNRISWRQNGSDGKYRILFSTNAPINDFNKFQAVQCGSNLNVTLTNFKHAVPGPVSRPYWYAVTVRTGTAFSNGNMLVFTNKATNSAGQSIPLLFWGDWGAHDISSFTYLSFYIKKLKGDLSQLAVNIAKDTNVNPLISSYASLASNVWTRVIIPLDDFQNLNRTTPNWITFRNSHTRGFSFALDEVKFIDRYGQSSSLVWGELSQHTAIVNGGGSTNAYAIFPVGGAIHGNNYYEYLVIPQTNATVTPVTNRKPIVNAIPSLNLSSVIFTNNGSGRTIIRWIGSDGDRNACSYLLAEYSTNGTVWMPMTADMADARHAASPFVLPPSGTNVSFVWNTRNDIGVTAKPSVRIRLQLTDGLTNSTIKTSLSFPVDCLPPPDGQAKSPLAAAWVNTTAPTLAWNTLLDGSGIRSYQVQLNDSPLFVSPLLKTNVLSTNLTAAGLANGVTYYWRVCGIDNFGNQGNYSVVRSFSVDATAPQAAQPVSPVSNHLSASGTSSFVWTKPLDAESGVSSVVLEVDSVGPAFANIERSTNIVAGSQTNAVLILSDGTKYWRIRTINGAGVQSISKVWPLRIDTLPPSVPSLVYMTNGAFTNQQTVRLSWRRSTDANGIAGYQIQVNGTNNFVVAPLTNFTRTFSAGTHGFKVRAQDNAGNYSAFSASNRFTVDLTGPTAPFLHSPANNRTNRNPNYNFVWSQSSDGSGIKLYQFVLNGMTNVSMSTTFASVLGEGKSLWKTRAMDQAGNFGPFSAIYSNFVDSIPPAMVSRSTPLSNALLSSSNCAFGWTASADAGTGVSKYILQYAKNPAMTIGLVTRSTDTTSFSVKLGGTNYWRIRAYDKAGNTNAWSSVWTFSVDTSQIVPILMAPLHLTLTNNPNPLYKWTTNASASRYWIEVRSNNISGKRVASNTNVLLGSALLTPLNNGTYVWRVRAQKSAGFVWQPWSAANAISVDTVAPPAPSAYFPLSGLVTNLTAPVLRWSRPSDASGILGYQVVLDSVTNWVVSTNYSASSLGQGVHAWRVRAKDSAGNFSPFSAAETFTVDLTGPAVPLLHLPAADSTNRVVPILFRWSQVADSGGGVTAGYRIVVGGLTNIVSSTSVSFSPGDGIHQWTVQGFDSEGNYGSWSASRNLIVDTVSPIAGSMIFPTNNQKLGTSSFSLSWNPAVDSLTGVRRYFIQVAKNAAFTLAVTTWSTNVTTLPGNWSGTNWWRIRASDKAGNTNAWSPAWAFVVETNQLIPSLLYPTDAVLTNNNFPVFGWTSLLGADKYHLEIRTNDLSGRVVLSNDNILANSANPGILEDGRYVWRVRAYKGSSSAWQNWSSTRQIRIDTVKPTMPTMLMPRVGLVTNQTSINFRWNASYDLNGVKRYKLWIDGATNWITHPTTNYNSGILGAGVHTWRMRVEDLAGNLTSVSAPSNFTIDLSAPAVPAILGSAVRTNRTLPVLLQWLEPTDAGGSFVSGYQVVFDGLTNWTVTTNLTFSPADGWHVWKIRAKDSAGNYGSWSPNQQVLVDTGSPSVPTGLFSPSAGATVSTQRPRLSWPVSSDPNGISAYLLILDGVTNLVHTNSFMPNADLAIGSHQWQVMAVDSVGNRSGPSIMLSFIIKIGEMEIPVGGFRADPNPFPVSTDKRLIIRYDQTGMGKVQFEIFTLYGSLVKILEDKESSGKVEWDGKNTEGHDVSTGIYLIIMRNDGVKQGSGVFKLGVIR